MKINNSKSKENLVNRLRRIEGQLRGIQAMVAEERECREVLQQLTAARSALQATTQYFLQEYASDCLINLDDKAKDERRQVIEDLFDMLGKSI